MKKQTLSAWAAIRAAIVQAVLNDVLGGATIPNQWKAFEDGSNIVLETAMHGIRAQAVFADAVGFSPRKSLVEVELTLVVGEHYPADLELPPRKVSAQVDTAGPFIKLLEVNKSY